MSVAPWCRGSRVVRRGPVEAATGEAASVSSGAVTETVEEVTADGEGTLLEEATIACF